MILAGRRRFLLAAGAATFAALGAKVRFDTPVAHASAEVLFHVDLPETLYVLSVAEYVTLAAACDRIFPRDDTPGAVDLGAPVYIDRALAERPPLPWADGFRAGLARLQADAMGRLGVPFGRASHADQETLLAERDASPDPEEARFLRSLVTATLEGALGDPAYGGNAAGAGWVELGFPVDPFAKTRMP
ncbi:MAG TPA: gluconate 2-dehydrogenase subunit 3 family protein [Polyangiaceae bacterium]